MKESISVGRKRLSRWVTPPKAPQGVPCNVCVNECRIPEAGLGYCGLRRNEKGKLVGAKGAQFQGLVAFKLET